MTSKRAVPAAWGACQLLGGPAPAPGPLFPVALAGSACRTAQFAPRPPCLCLFPSVHIRGRFQGKGHALGLWFLFSGRFCPEAGTEAATLWSRLL